MAVKQLRSVRYFSDDSLDNLRIKVTIKMVPSHSAPVDKQMTAARRRLEMMEESQKLLHDNKQTDIHSFSRIFWWQEKIFSPRFVSLLLPCSLLTLLFFCVSASEWLRYVHPRFSPQTFLDRQYQAEVTELLNKEFPASQDNHVFLQLCPWFPQRFLSFFHFRILLCLRLLEFVFRFSMD